MLRRRLPIAALLALTPLLSLAPLSLAQQPEKVDLSVIHRIKTEVLGRNSKVMDHVFYLTDVNGPRLANSSGTISTACAAASMISIGAPRSTRKAARNSLFDR